MIFKLLITNSFAMRSDQFTCTVFRLKIDSDNKHSIHKVILSTRILKILNGVKILIDLSIDNANRSHKQARA